MDAVFQLADRISVLVYGKVLTSGDAAHVKGHQSEVQAAYLGTEEMAHEACRAHGTRRC
jgi:branched-chain amino acid transport system ATP-binding protein